jgi:RNA methyltransferase, TrmH family
MLSKNQLKHIRKLNKKKYRQETGLFVAEGEKVVRELLNSGWKAHEIYATHAPQDIPHTPIEQSLLNSVSHLFTASPILAIFHMPKYKQTPIGGHGFSIALDSIADPGNLGTIIRLCDWFGIKNIYCSPNTVDCFNPKVVQSTMGSIARVQCHYTDLVSLVDHCESEVYAATLNGNSHYEQTFSSNGLLVMGSESHGIGEELLKKIRNRVTIPAFSTDAGPESLNVANATAILLNEIFRP